MKFKSDSDDAVSPVIGVMLMLVVTIIIAAVVSAFGTGVVSDVDSTPTAVIKVSGYDVKEASSSEGYDLMSLSLKHMSGDTLNTKDLKLIIVRNGMTYSFDFDNSSTKYSVSGNGSSWSVGETIIFTAKSSTANGLLQQSMILPSSLQMQIVTSKGGIIFETDVPMRP